MCRRSEPCEASTGKHNRTIVSTTLTYKIQHIKKHCLETTTFETDTSCAACNDADIEGFLSVIPVGHTSPNNRHHGEVLSTEDEKALTRLSKEFEIDFLCLSTTEHAADIEAARALLASLGLDNTQVKQSDCWEKDCTCTSKLTGLFQLKAVGNPALSTS